MAIQTRRFPFFASAPVLQQRCCSTGALEALNNKRGSGHGASNHDILIAVEHADVRRGLRDILADAFPGARLSEVSNGDEVLKCVARKEYTLLLLDIDMPPRSGLEVLQDVKLSRPKMPVVVVSIQAEEQYVRYSLRAGAAAFITKNSAPEELPRVAAKILVNNALD
jgi:DNA-binding NarL/FixJ family response regulator